MCGLAAIFSYHPVALSVNKHELSQVCKSMKSRGPDGSGLWISADKRIGLAHRRLAIIDLSDAGAQPMSGQNGKLRIVFNGEIYNYRQLRKTLELKGYQFRSDSDTEVLLCLYQEYGCELGRHLRGMYAFAIWDIEKQGILLVRDPFGIKPLYYADDGKTLRVASQVKALLAGGKINTSPEPAGYVGFYLWGHVPEPYTLYQGVRALKAGSALWMDTTGRKELTQFFNLMDELVRAEQHKISVRPAEVREVLHSALLESVRHHLVSDVPVGALLSAGLDSTAVVALAKETGVNDLRTVTLGFREFAGTQNDETVLAQQVAQHYGTQHQTQWVQKEDFGQNLDHLLAAMDQPSIDGVNTYFACKAVKDSGLKVALSGLGGDELFGGYPSFQQIPQLVRLLSPFQSLPLLGRGFCYLTAPVLKHFTSPKYAGLLEYGGSYGGAYLLRRGFYMPWELIEVLDADLVQQGWQELQTLSHLKQTSVGVTNPHLQVTALETSWYMQNQLLRDSDWASMAHSVELRVPLVDIELFKTVTGLIAAGHLVSKRDMALTPTIALPDVILNRQKTGFSIPVRDWLLNADKGRGRCSERGLRAWAKLVIEKHKG
jgi:asparagine synthase (glutamine-hydrolysing)